MTCKGLGSTAAVRHVLAERSEGAAGTYNGIEQAAGGSPVAELQPVRDNVSDSQVLRQGPHQMVEGLTDQYDISAGLDQLLDGPNALGLEARLELVFKVLFPEQVEAVPGHTS